MCDDDDDDDDVIIDWVSGWMRCLLEQRDHFSKARFFFSDIVVEHRVREFFQHCCQ